MNVSVSITEEGVSPNLADHRELNAKILVYRRLVFRLFLIYLFISNHAQMHIWFTLFENQKEPSLLSDRGKWRSGKQSDILEWLKTYSCDESKKIIDAAAIVHIWSEPSKLQAFNNTQNVIS